MGPSQGEASGVQRASQGTTRPLGEGWEGMDKCSSMPMKIQVVLKTKGSHIKH